MNFDYSEARAILERTPTVVRTQLAGLPEPWLSANEGADTWTPREVVAHLIGGEKTDWVPRVRHLMEHGEGRPFAPFDRTGEIVASRGRPFEELLREFAELRRANLAFIDGLRLDPDALERTSIHPDFGRVHLRQLLATWAVHDLTHLAQIQRVLAKQYAEAVGPWRAYLGVLR